VLGADDEIRSPAQAVCGLRAALGAAECAVNRLEVALAHDMLFTILSWRSLTGASWTALARACKTSDFSRVVCQRPSEEKLTGKRCIGKFLVDRPCGGVALFVPGA
jgi:hypothetical protein